MKQQSLLTYFGAKNHGTASVASVVDLTEEDSIESRSFYSTSKAPLHKIISEGPFAVDAFSFGSIYAISCYFLTHFHSDHYDGLNSKWKHGRIYCSPVTAVLLVNRLRVSSSFVHPIELNKPFVSPDSRCTITFHDANHCPGSVMIEFDFHLANKRILHTGDFRYSRELPHFDSLFGRAFDRIYLDNTYWNPSYSFPSQPQAILQAIMEIERISSEKRTLVLVGSYFIGKERVFIQLALHFGMKIFMAQEKCKIARLLQLSHLDSLLTSNQTEAQLHVVSMGTLTWRKLNAYFSAFWPHYQQIVAVIPTGWTQTQRKKSPSHFYHKNAGRITNAIHYVQVPYSEHSSYAELREFVSKIDCEWFIGTSSGNFHGKRMHKNALLPSIM